jgi:fucose 4-O-acetylase-like acetyltransferase
MQYKARLPLWRPPLWRLEAPSLASPHRATPTARTSASTTTRQDIEYLRLFNSFCIVYFHASLSLPVWLKGCLLVFIITTSFLSGAQHRAFSWPIQRLRARRLMVPWACWFLLYGLLNLKQGQPLVWHTPGAWGLISDWLSGSAVHLWYVPFAFFGLMLLDAAHARWQERTVAWGAIGLSILWLALAGWWRPWVDELPSPWASYATVLVGLGIGIFYRHLHRLNRWHAAGALLALLAVAWLQRDIPSVGLNCLMGVALTCTLLLPRLPRLPLPDIHQLSNCTFGVYLVHGLVMNQVHKLAGLSSLQVAAITFAVSLALTWLLRKLAPKVASCCS